MRWCVVLQTDKAGARAMLQQSLQSLQECLQILSLQAASTFPGQLHAAVSSTRADMERAIRSMMK